MVGDGNKGSSGKGDGNSGGGKGDSKGVGRAMARAVTRAESQREDLLYELFQIWREAVQRVSRRLKTFEESKATAREAPM